MYQGITTHELIETIKRTLEREERVKICHKYQADKALQIQLHNGDNYNLYIVKLEDDGCKIKRKL